MRLTRRSVVGTLAGAPLAAAGWTSARAQAPVQGFGQGFGQSAGLRVRRSLGAMHPNDPDLVALRQGIGWMRANPGPLSWITQRQVHASPWGHHNSWRFLPWHRFQLHYLERIIAHVTGKPDFAMPYWNWQDDHAPAAFFQRRSPLFDNTRTITSASRISSYIGFEWGPGLADGDFWGRTDNEFGDFFGSQNPTGVAGMGYAGSAEQYGHNLIHLFVGGRMRNLMESPLDPLFWAHHSNVDRQWAIWTEIHGAQTYPREWGLEPCTGYVDGDGFLAPARTAAECADTRPMGYTYDDLGIADRYRARDRWPGQPDPTPQHVIQQALQSQRQTPSLVRIFVPAQMLSNLKGAVAPQIDAAGFLQVLGPDGYVVRLTSRSLDGAQIFGQDAIFSVPMGAGMMMGAHPAGHRVQLKRLIPRNVRALAEGLWIEAEAAPLRGERTEARPEVTSFVLTYRSQI